MVWNSIRRYLSTMRALAAHPSDLTPDDNPMNFPIADIDNNLQWLRTDLVQVRQFQCYDFSDDDDDYLKLVNYGGSWNAETWGNAEDDYTVLLPAGGFYLVHLTLGVCDAFGANYGKQRVAIVNQADGLLSEGVTFITHDPEEAANNLGVLHASHAFASNPGVTSALRLKPDSNTFPDSTSENPLATGLGNLIVVAFNTTID
ncbi:MAG TPA: hypothetical protein VHO25_17295 [Polyangiaceae bacterium]|nr:hypothetical protein [Polyangiaceae bacterium]